MQSAQTNVTALIEANAILADVANAVVEDLFSSPKDPLPSFQIKIQPVKVEPPKKLATYSQLMTVAHAINRKYGHEATKGCNCHSCNKIRKAA